MKGKAQVTLYIIIGILVLVFIGLLAYVIQKQAGTGKDW